ncbi:MAG: hypothetical protein ACM3NV_10755, partial [Syntrophothermus sp.]
EVRLRTPSPPSERNRQVAVIGSSRCAPGSELPGLAEDVGRGLAEAGVTIVCGAGGGVREAAARGAAAAGGRVIGIVPGESIAAANPYCTEVVASGIGHGRNLAVVASGEVVVAVGGEWGTLSEIGMARTIGRTVVALSSWELSGHGEMENSPGVVRAATPKEAVAAALATLT